MLHPPFKMGLWADLSRCTSAMASTMIYAIPAYLYFRSHLFNIASSLSKNTLGSRYYPQGNIVKLYQVRHVTTKLHSEAVCTRI